MRKERDPLPRSKEESALACMRLVDMWQHLTSSSLSKHFMKGHSLSLMVLPLAFAAPVPPAWQADPGILPTARCSGSRSDELASSRGGDLQGPSEKQQVAGPERDSGDPGSTGLQELGSS